MAGSEDLRLSFNEAAEIYDRVRPSYPADLFDALFQMLPSEPEIVEVGPGTGQATKDLLARGASVLAIEIGPAIAAKLRSNLPSDRLRVAVGDFEVLEIVAGEADAVFSATAYHGGSVGRQASDIGAFPPEQRIEARLRAGLPPQAFTDGPMIAPLMTIAPSRSPPIYEWHPSGARTAESCTTSSTAADPRNRSSVTRYISLRAHVLPMTPFRWRQPDNTMVCPLASHGRRSRSAVKKARARRPVLRCWYASRSRARCSCCRPSSSDRPS
jgi:hypothetical protein